jgi:5-methylcytosine-specific restriction endonuclease McrA
MSDPTYMQNFLHPPKKPPKPAVRVMKDGREICDQLTKAGRDEYTRRKRWAWEDQKHICAICHKPLTWADTTADHIQPRGMGGGRRDDSQKNLAAVHWKCNAERGSKTSGYYGVP